MATSCRRAACRSPNNMTGVTPTAYWQPGYPCRPTRLTWEDVWVVCVHNARRNAIAVTRLVHKVPFMAVALVGVEVHNEHPPRQCWKHTPHVSDGHRDVRIPGTPQLIRWLMHAHTHTHCHTHCTCCALAHHRTYTQNPWPWSALAWWKPPPRLIAQPWVKAASAATAQTGRVTGPSTSLLSHSLTAPVTQPNSHAVTHTHSHAHAHSHTQTQAQKTQKHRNTDAETHRHTHTRTNRNTHVVRTQGSLGCIPGTRVAREAHSAQPHLHTNERTALAEGRATATQRPAGSTQGPPVWTLASGCSATMPGIAWNHNRGS